MIEEDKDYKYIIALAIAALGLGFFALISYLSYMKSKEKVNYELTTKKNKLGPQSYQYLPIHQYQPTYDERLYKNLENIETNQIAMQEANQLKLINMQEANQLKLTNMQEANQLKLTAIHNQLKSIQPNPELNTKISNIENTLNYLNQNQQQIQRSMIQQQPMIQETNQLDTQQSSKADSIKLTADNQLNREAISTYDLKSLKTPKKPINSISNMKSKEETERIRQMFGML